MSSLPKVPNVPQRVVTNKESQKASAVNSSLPTGKDPAVSVPREAPASDILVEGPLGHVVTIKDQSGDATQFYKYFVFCKCGFQSRQNQFEFAKRIADYHVYHHTRR